MKIILEEKDKSYIDKVNKILAEGEQVPLFVNGIGNNYGISFKVTDIAKANAFIASIVLTPNAERQKEIMETIGIDFTAVTFSQGDIKTQELKQFLQRMLTELEESGL